MIMNHGLAGKQESRVSEFHPPSWWWQRESKGNWLSSPNFHPVSPFTTFLDDSDSRSLSPRILQVELGNIKDTARKDRPPQELHIEHGGQGLCLESGRRQKEQLAVCSWLFKKKGWKSDEEKKKVNQRFFDYSCWWCYSMIMNPGQAGQAWDGIERRKGLELGREGGGVLTRKGLAFHGFPRLADSVFHGKSEAAHTTTHTFASSSSSSSSSSILSSFSRGSIWKRGLCATSCFFVFFYLKLFSSSFTFSFLSPKRRSQWRGPCRQWRWQSWSWSSSWGQSRW